jgi:hypothetical protein
MPTKWLAPSFSNLPTDSICFGKAPLFSNQSCAILSSFKIVAIFNNKSADFVLISADILLKMTTILKKVRIPQLRSKNKWTLLNSTRQWPK